VLGIPDEGVCSPVACWPEGQSASPELLSAAREAMSSQRGVLHKNTDNDATGNRVDVIACPLTARDRLIGIVAVEVVSRPEAQQRAVLQLLKWGATWLEMLFAQQESISRQPLVTVLELIALCLEHASFKAAANAVVNELGTRLDCSRVSLGFLQGNRIRIRAVSQLAGPGNRSRLVRALETTMEEAVDQDSVIVYPDRDTCAIPPVTRNHARLSLQYDDRALCTVPLVSNGAMVGALLLERPEDRPFEDRTVALCTHLAALLGPTLELRRRDDRWLLTKIAAALHSGLARLLGPRHTGMKLAGLALAALLGFGLTTPGNYRVSADAVLEGRIQRAVVAPVDGFIATSGIKAGDIVRQGQVMGQLEDQDLQLERQKWTSQKAQYSREYRNALAEHDRARSTILSAQIDQAEAQLRLATEQLARMQITAPFDGVVVSGDLSQSLGSPVERGEVLFEVAPLDDYRLVLQVGENDIPQVKRGQSGELRLAGMPGEALPFVVQKLTPVAESSAGGNTFRVEAVLESTVAQLRPGMEGIGKIAIGQRKLFWIWTHSLVDWLRLQIWSWWP
jgi:RND family efflux transporter MFP subunit